MGRCCSLIKNGVAKWGALKGGKVKSGVFGAVEQQTGKLANCWPCNGGQMTHVTRVAWH